MTLRVGRRLRPVLLPAAVRRRSSCRSALLSATTAVWALDRAADRRVRGRRRPCCPCRATVRWWIVLLAGAVVAVRSTRSSSARSARSCSCCSRSAGAGWTTRSGSGVERRPRARRSSSSRRSCSSGRCSRGRLAGGRRRARSSLGVLAVLATRARRRRRLVRLRHARSGRSATRSRRRTTSRRARSPTRLGRLGRARVAHPAGLDGRRRSWPSSRPRRLATAEASYLVAVVASQLLSPVLWDHYALLLLLPVAWLLAARPLVGARSSRSRPPRRSSGSRRAIVYPIVLLSSRSAATFGVGDPRAGRAAAGVTLAAADARLDPARRVVGLGRRRASRPSSTGSANRGFDAGRGDFFYLADAFLHGRTWLDFRPGPVRRDRRRRPRSTCRSRRSRRSR